MAEVERGPAAGQESSLISLIASTAGKSSVAIPSDFDDPRSSSQAYLSSLTSQSLINLRGQPAALSTAKSSLNTQLSLLCSQHVSSFVQVHHATSSLPHSLLSLDSALESLLERDLPALSNVAQQFSQQVEAPLLAKEKAQNLILQYELSLKDLLDIPRLLMTCVRANHPVEALQLAAHMMRIGAQSDQSNVHRALQEECWDHLKKLREDLLRSLGARGLRLPAAKRLVSLLRKFKDVDEANEARVGDLDTASIIGKLSLSDSILCLSFLQSRWSLIEEITSNANSTKSTSALSLHLSTWRDVVGDSCSMAMILFAATEYNEQDELCPDTLISIFCHQSLKGLRQLLSESIPYLREEATSLQENLNTLSALHTQLSYSAASLSRQGVEISRIISGQEVFQLEVIALWKRALSENNSVFKRCRQGKIATDHSSWVAGGNVQKILQIALSDFSTSTELSVLVKYFYDLVVFINGLLECYNALLSFAPMTVGKEVMSALDETFVEVVGPLFVEMQANERVELHLSLSPILSDNGQSRYYEHDTARQSEANSAILARVLAILCGPAMNLVRGLLRDLFESNGKEQSEQLSNLRKEALEWAQQSEKVWQEGEKTRIEKVRLVEEEVLAKENRKREQDQARQIQMEARRVEEELRQSEMEKQRVEEEARRKQEEDARRKEKEEEADSKAVEEEAARARAEEEARLRKEEKKARLQEIEEAAQREAQQAQEEQEAAQREAQQAQEEQEAAQMQAQRVKEQERKEEEEKSPNSKEGEEENVGEEQEAEDMEGIEKADIQQRKVDEVESEKELPQEEQIDTAVERKGS